MTRAAGSAAPTDHAAEWVEVRPVTGLPEFRPGDDLAGAITAAAPWLADGDVVVVTSKVVSKVEGRLRPAREHRELVLAESERIVAGLGDTLITRNRLGITQAAAGIDRSNVGVDELILLPEDPDASAARLRLRLADLGVAVAVIITDTMGRAWRVGQTDAAIGASGLEVLWGYAGVTDRHGNRLAVTSMALADEIAAAADLVKGKTAGIPVAVVRGVPGVGADGPTAADLIRPPGNDLFHTGVREAVLLRRSVREFTDAPVDPDALRRAMATALTAPAPHHSRPVRFVWVRTPDRRVALLDATRAAWRRDLTADGLDERAVTRGLARGALLRRAPELVIPFLVTEAAHTYPDQRRQQAEHTMFTVAGGAAVGGLLTALAAEGLGSCWVGSTIFCPRVTAESLAVPGSWRALGAIAIGHPVQPLTVRPRAPLTNGVIEL